MVISKQKLGFCVYSAYKKFEIISLVTAMHGFLLAIKLMPVEPKELYAKSMATLPSLNHLNQVTQQKYLK